MKIMKIMKKVLLLIIFVVSLSTASYSQSVDRFPFDYTSIIKKGEKEDIKKFRHIIELRENSISIVSSRGSVRLNILKGSGGETIYRGEWYYYLIAYAEGSGHKVEVLLGKEEVIIEENGVIIVFYN